jgi:hypothetical protein
MKEEIESRGVGGGVGGGEEKYWRDVRNRLNVRIARVELKDIRDGWLQKQLVMVEERKKYLEEHPEELNKNDDDGAKGDEGDDGVAKGVKSTDSDAEEGDEEQDMGVSDEVDMSRRNAGYKWNDKHKPRKPRYFNRVKAGWDWNKYNQTHYDHENPPPKVIQGYKFNVFYPDLIDKNSTPKYFLEKADTDDYCIIRFSAGAPYEDIAFKIINKEWAKGKKKGFKCVFERGVLSLFFNFNSHWYRR